MMNETKTGAEEAIDALTEYKKTGEKVNISDNAANVLNLTRDSDTHVAHWACDIDPVYFNLYYTNTTWVLLETHTNQQGPERVIHYISAGRPTATHEELDLDAARSVLENDDYWTADIDQTIDAIETRQTTIDHWWLDSLQTILGVVGDEQRMYLTSPEHHIEFHNAPDLDDIEQVTLRDTLSAIHPALGDYTQGYDHPFVTEFVVTVTWDTRNLNPESLVESQV